MCFTVSTEISANPAGCDPHGCFLYRGSHAGCTQERRVLRKESSQGFRHGVGKLVLRNSIPDIEDKKMTAGLQNPMRFLVTANFVRKEHNAELTCHNIKALIRKRQRQSVGLLPFNPMMMIWMRLRTLKHLLI